MMSPVAPSLLAHDAHEDLSCAPAARAAPRGETDASARIVAAVRSHHTFVWRCLRRLGVPASSADDATQHVFLAFSQRVSDVPLEKERPFLFGVAVRVAANARKVSSRAREQVWDDDVTQHVPSGAPGPHDELEQKERLAVLDELLDALPLECRTVFVLAELERMTAQEISAYVDAPVGTVNSRLRRARELVQRNIPRLRARHGGGTP